MHKFIPISVICLVSLNHTVQADGIRIDKIYDPYVQILETEIEYRGYYTLDDDKALDNNQLHKLGIGRAITQNWFAEAYLIGFNNPATSFSVDAIELEFKWQLTEQGEYNNDWGLLFELERNYELNSWEYANTLIVLHEWSRWTGTANIELAYEWGSGISDEFETAVNAQLKYRYRAELEPNIELFLAEDTRAIGPTLSGRQGLGNRRALFWNTGIILGLDSKTPDATIKLELEYEF